MDTFSEPLIDSATTGLPSPEPRAESSTGPGLGATGYEKTPTTLAGADLMMDTYVEDLSDLPADLLDGACTHWRRTERFFPTIAELRALAVPALAKRKKYLERLLTLRGVAELPAPDGVVTFAWLSDRRAAGRRAATAP